MRNKVALLLAFILPMILQVSAQTRVVTDIELDLDGELIQVNDVYTLGIETESGVRQDLTCIYLRRTEAPSHRVHSCFEYNSVTEVLGEIQEEGADITIVLFVNIQLGFDYNCSISLPANPSDEGSPSMSC